MPDITVIGNPTDTVFILHPTSEAGQEWLETHIDPEAPRFGKGIAVEHRYIEPILEGLIESGLSIEHA